MKVKDSLAAAHQVTISAQLEECLLIDPGELLLGNWDLYVAIFDRLTRGPTWDKLDWLAEMDSAQGAADHIARGSCQAFRSQYCAGPRPWMQTEYKYVLIDWP